MRWAKLGNLIRRFQLDIPAGLRPELYFASLLTGPISFGIALGIQAMLTGIILIRPKREAHAVDQLTGWGAMWFSPEHDVTIYLVGCALTIVLILGLTWAWNHRLHRNCSTEVQRFAIFSGTFQMLLGFGGLTSYIVLFLYLRQFVPDWSEVPATAVVALICPGLVSLLIAAIGFKFTPAAFSEYLARCQFRHHFADTLLDIAVPIFIFIVVYIPAWRHLTGHHVFLQDEFHHWDYFAMGPALGYSHGAALGTEIYTQYGVGWPVLFTAISSILPLSYGHVMHIAVIYGCLYFSGVYIFLRLLLRNATWAATGVILALLLGLFIGNAPGEVKWGYPSSTILRSPLDIWFFIATLSHLQSKRPIWALIAAVVVGLAILFQTDTGLYLGVTFVFYLTFSSRLLSAPERSFPGKSHLLLSLGSCVVTLSVLLLGLGIASRWTVFRKGFWVGWLEGLRLYGSGFSMLPIATDPDDAAIVLFILMAGTYLLTVGYLMIKLLHGETTYADLLLGCLALYGLLTLLYFVGRSHLLNLFNSSIPFGMVLVSVASRAHNYLTLYLKRSSLTHEMRQLWVFNYHLIAYVMLAIVSISLSVNPGFRSYPSLLKGIMRGPPPEGLCLMRDPKDVCGLPPDKQDFIRQFEEVTDRIKVLMSTKNRVAILDDRDTIFYLAAGGPPWARYSPLFPNLLTKERLEKVKSQLLIHPPDYVLVRKVDLAPSQTLTEEYFSYSDVDVWIELRAAIQQYYTLDGDIGPFEIWHHIQN